MCVNLQGPYCCGEPYTLNWLNFTAIKRHGNYQPSFLEQYIKFDGALDPANGCWILGHGKKPADNFFYLKLLKLFISNKLYNYSSFNNLRVKLGIMRPKYLEMRKFTMKLFEVTNKALTM